MKRLIEPPSTGPTPAQAARMREVHDLAAEFGTLPDADRIPYLVTVGRLQTSGYDRFKTIQHTPPDSPLFKPLMGLLDALVASEAGPDGRTVDTKHGIFTEADLREAEATTTRTEVLFPVRHPWAVKPVIDKETRTVITPGTRGPAVFRSADERATGPALKPFSVEPPMREAPEEDDPWRTG